MFVRLKYGPHAGEEVEMKYADALPLLNDGRAERVNFNGAEIEKPKPPVASKARTKDRKK